MPGFVYRSTVTKRLYTSIVNLLPKGAETVVINGEIHVPCNNDGSVARGVKGGPPPGDPYSFVIYPSPWEKA